MEFLDIVIIDPIEGIVEWFNSEKGFGIGKLRNGKKIFLHTSNTLDEKSPKPNNKILITAIEPPKKKGKKDIARAWEIAD